MKMVLVSFSEHPSLQNYMYLLAKNMTASGVETYTVGSAKVQVPQHNSEKSMLVDTTERPTPSVSSFKKLKAALKRICMHIESITPETIVFVSKHTWNVFLMMWLKRHVATRIIHVYHDPLGHKGDRVRMAVIAYNWCCARIADGIVVHSSKGYEDVKRVFKPRYLYNIPLGCCEWIDYRENTHQSKKVLVFGRMNRYKGLELLPELAVKLYEKDPDIKIIVTGKKSSDLPDEVIVRMKEQPNIVVSERYVPEEELNDIFYTSDLVLVMHTSITQSGVLLDAFRHSRPVICFDIDGIHDYVKDERSLVQGFNLDEMANRVVTYLNDQRLSREIALKAWEYGQSHFSDQIMAAQLLNAAKAMKQGDRK